MQAAVEQ